MAQGHYVDIRVSPTGLRSASEHYGLPDKSRKKRRGEGR
jgi:hypothetical protein